MGSLEKEEQWRNEKAARNLPAAGQGSCAGCSGRHNFCPVAIRKGRGRTERSKREPHAVEEKSPWFSLICCSKS